MAVKRLPPSRQQGFILAAVLWTLAIMFIAVGIFHTYVQRKLAVAIQAKAHLQQILDAESTQQSLLYLLSTSRMTMAGLTGSKLDASQQGDESFSVMAPVGDEIWLDGTAYQGVGSARFSIQDNAGLVSLNTADMSVIGLLLSSFDRDESQVAHLLAALTDYEDADDKVSLGGAEKTDYAMKGLPLPSNDYLRSEPELNRVMGWREWLAAHPELDVQNFFSLRRISVMNLNAMPKLLLEKLVGLTPELAERFVQERKTNPFRSTEDFLLRTSTLVPLDDEKLRYFPSNELRIRIWNKGGGQAQLISLQLTPNGLLGPWLVDYEYSVQSVENNNEALADRQSTLFNNSLGVNQRGH